jgi:hypothetical protein
MGGWKTSKKANLNGSQDRKHVVEATGMLCQEKSRTSGVDGAVGLGMLLAVRSVYDQRV